MKGNSLNDKKKVQNLFLKRVEKLCGEEMAEELNHNINWHMIHNPTLPPYVIKSHYRSLASGISKPVKYVNKVSR